MALPLGEIRWAAGALAGVAARTPLLEWPLPGTGARVRLKCEQLQPVGSFKIRGAYTALARLPPERRRAGVVTFSSGNHGLAVAWSARALGLRAVVVMPEAAPPVKRNAVREAGAEVVLAGPVRSPEQAERAHAIARAEGMTLLPPANHPDVIAGQATCGLEILEQWPEVETILAPVGGGGLLAGIAAAVAALKPTVRVVGVEPDGAAKLTAALARGAPVALPETRSIADGLLPRAVEPLAWEILRPVVREAVRVSDVEIAGAVKLLYGTAGIRVEPSGAAATAALTAGKLVPSGPTVAVLSGGNVEPALFDALVH